ncbi:uncharacterized protein [Euwallacea fornicatus]|uniref:uncharacterized protein n=1 Tax=Euwallacea fornicatus TaxID=995702 RepID=UPI00338FEC50
MAGNGSTRVFPHLELIFFFNFLDDFWRPAIESIETLTGLIIRIPVLPTVLRLNFLVALIQVFLIIENFTFSFFIRHAWEFALNMTGISYMALFSCRHDIAETLAYFKETHSWDSYSMGRKIHQKIKCDAAGKIALFALFCLLGLALNIMAGIFYSDIMQREFLIQRAMPESFSHTKLSYLLMFGLTLTDTVGIFTVFRYFYHVVHLRYQFLLLREYVRRAARKSGSDEQKEVVAMVWRRHQVLKEWSLVVMEIGKTVLLTQITFGGFFVICTSLRAIFIPEMRVLFGSVLLFQLAYVHCLTYFGQNFENMFEELYEATVQAFDWFEWDTESVKNYMFVIQNMQKVLKMEIPMFISLNYITEVRILKGSYALGSMIVSIAARNSY